MQLEQLLHIDKNHVWHPYSSANGTMDNWVVKGASGVHLFLETGEKLVDGMSSWWSVIHGYNHPILNHALVRQTEQMAHVMFGGLTHRPAAKLTELLLKIVPEGLNHVFYCDSGSVAVEVAMKMAIQYWFSKGVTSKSRFATIRNGYHGDTWHAMSVCDPDTGMHHIFNKTLPQQYFLPAPISKFCGGFNSTELEEVEKLLSAEKENIAAFILEPIVQGAGGMRFYHPQYLKKVRELCNNYEILLIADEIATGFGRTGELFGSNHANISPDILCLGKAITGGYISFAATLCTHEIAATISENEPGVFMHGPTFMGNPLACSLAKASITLLLENNWEQNIRRIENHFLKTLPALSNLSAVQDVRVLGAIGVVEMKENVALKIMQQKLVQYGVWLRPFGKLIYTMPPYIISNSELNILTSAMINSIKEVYE